MLHDPTQWVGNLFDDNAEDVYTEWKRRHESLTYIFTQDVDKLDKDFNSNFVVVDGEYPTALQLYLTNEICIETLVILDDLLGFSKSWDKNIAERYVWPSKSQLIRKYRPFMAYDKVKFKQILLDLITQ